MKKRRNETTRQPIGEKQVNRRMLGIRVILPTTVPQVYDAHVRILCHFSFHFFFFFFSFPYRYLHTRAQDSYEPIFPLFRDALFPPLPWLTVFLLKGLENYYSRGRMLDSGNNFPRRSFHFQNYFVEVDEAVTLSWYNFNLKKVLSRGRMNYNSATKWVIISTSWWNLI